MFKGNTGIRYWKISSGYGGDNWAEFKDNDWISMGSYTSEVKDWRKTKSGNITKNPDQELIKNVLKEEFEEPIFSWDKVPGIDSNKLLGLLRKHPEIGLMENAKITKIENDRTIRIDSEEDPYEITLNENNMEAILKISYVTIDGKIDDIEIYAYPFKEENGQINIYRDEAPSKRSIASSIAQIAAGVRLFLEIKPMDKVIVYDTKYHINAMCEVTGEYELEKEFHYPHTKKVKWLKIFDEPLNIKDLKLDTNISQKRTVIEMNKNDWDTIYNYASAIPSETHMSKDLIEKALKELGKRKALKDELIPKLKEIVERNGGVLVDDKTAWQEINDLNED